MVVRTRSTNDLGKYHQNLASQRHQCKDSRAQKYTKNLQGKKICHYIHLKIHAKLLNQPSTLFLRRIKWYGDWMLMVRSISLRKKALPGWITEHAKFRRPAKDCTSLNVTFFLSRKSEIRLWTLNFFPRASEPLTEWYPIQFRRMTK